MMTTMMRNWCIGGPPSAIKKLQCFLQHKARTSTFTRVTISIGNTASLRQSMENSRCFNTIRCSVSKSESETSSSTAVQSKGHKTKAKFCQSCGGPTKKCIPEGEEKMRAVCTLCGDVYYENPKMHKVIMQLHCGHRPEVLFKEAINQQAKKFKEEISKQMDKEHFPKESTISSSKLFTMPS
eukprot:Gb_36754 [translate_table: standard]